MTKLLFQSKKNRDAIYSVLKKKGYIVKRSVVTNQQLHPQHIEDYKGSAKYDTGFGNTVYKTFFPKLYKITFYSDVGDPSEDIDVEVMMI